MSVFFPEMDEKLEENLKRWKTQEIWLKFWKIGKNWEKLVDGT